ncbi:MAG: hypothetical protein HC846_04265 [Blastocatellia bacterium]|nr:hypothetical protein [Blastocatellia bacterium]
MLHNHHVDQTGNDESDEEIAAAIAESERIRLEAEKATSVSQFRLSKAEWQKLNAFFITIQPPAQDELFASGDHYTLALMMYEFGLRPPEDAFKVYEMAENLLLQGYDE